MASEGAAEDTEEAGAEIGAGAARGRWRTETGTEGDFDVSTVNVLCVDCLYLGI